MRLRHQLQICTLNEIEALTFFHVSDSPFLPPSGFLPSSLPPSLPLDSSLLLSPFSFPSFLYLFHPLADLWRVALKSEKTNYIHASFANV